MLLPARPGTIACFSLAALCGGCRPREVPHVGLGDSSPPTSATSSTASTASTTASTAARAESVELVPDPVLVMSLDHGLGAVLLEEGGDVDGAAALRLLEREPMLSIGHPLDVEALSKDARTHLATQYEVGTIDGSRCHATREWIAVMHRIPADDPTAHRDPAVPEPAYLARMFGVAAGNGTSRVAIVRFDAPCASPMWAVPQGQPLPTPIAKRPMAADATKLLRTTLATAESYEALRAQSPKRAIPPLYALALGDDLVWARARGPEPTSPTTACFALHRKNGVLTVAATAPACPETVAGATRGPGSQVTVWFAHARAVLVGETIDVSYFPTASFVPSGGI